MRDNKDNLTDEEKAEKRLARLKGAFISNGKGGTKIDAAKLDEIGNMLANLVNQGKKFTVNTVAEYITSKWSNMYKDKEDKIKTGAIKTAARKALISLGVIPKPKSKKEVV